MEVGGNASADQGVATALGILLENMPRECYKMGDPLAVAQRWRPAADDEDGHDDEASSADPASRAAVYTSYTMTPEQIFAAYERDKNLAVDSCHHNDHLWKNPERRQALHDISWKACEFNDSYMDRANSFNYFKAERKKKHPGWFKDEEEPEETGNLPASKSDIDTLTEAIGSNEYMMRENLTFYVKLVQALQAINKRLAWVWWFSLGAVIASIWHHF